MNRETTPNNYQANANDLLSQLGNPQLSENDFNVNSLIESLGGSPTGNSHQPAPQPEHIGKANDLLKGLGDRVDVKPFEDPNKPQAPDVGPTIMQSVFDNVKGFGKGIVAKLVPHDYIGNIWNIRASKLSQTAQEQLYEGNYMMQFDQIKGQQLISHGNELLAKSKELSTVGKGLKDKYQNIIDSFVTPEQQQTFGYKLGMTATGMAEVLAITALTKSPMLGALALSSESAADIYNDAIQNNVDPDKATNLALTNLAMNTLLMRVSVGSIIKGSSKGIIDATAKAAMVNAVDNGAMQFGDNFMRWTTYKPNQDLMQGVFDAVLIGGIVGSGSAGVMHMMKTRFEDANLPPEQADFLVQNANRHVAEIKQAINPQDIISPKELGTLIDADPVLGRRAGEALDMAIEQHNSDIEFVRKSQADAQEVINTEMETLRTEDPNVRDPETVVVKRLDEGYTDPATGAEIPPDFEFLVAKGDFDRAVKVNEQHPIFEKPETFGRARDLLAQWEKTFSKEQNTEVELLRKAVDLYESRSKQVEGITSRQHPNDLISAKASDSRPIDQEVRASYEKLIGKNAGRTGENPQGALASKVSTPIGKFEVVNDPTASKAPFKISTEMQGVLNKYGVRTTGEGYNPRGAAGAYYERSQNIRLSGITDLSVASHEIAHHVDISNGVTKQAMRIESYNNAGQPVYDKGTLDVRRALTDVYSNFYPGGKPEHALDLRLKEGFAMFMEKMVEHPSMMSAKYPELVKEFLQPGGRFYNEKVPAYLKDMRAIVNRYNAQDALGKISTRVTDGTNVAHESFLNPVEKINQEVFDNIYPLEKISQMAGELGTEKDVSLMVRFRNNINGVVVNNLIPKKGYWTLKNKNMVKKFDFNWGDLTKDLGDKALLSDFGSYLVARDAHFNFLELKRLRDEVVAAKNMLEEKAFHDNEDIAAAKELIESHKKLEDQLHNNGITEAEAKAAYDEHQGRFKEYEDKFDKLLKADSEVMRDVGLIDSETYERYANQKGYAPLKRVFFDQLIGDPDFKPFGSQIQVGKTKISSTIQRKGSSREIVNPFVSAMHNHSEVMKKASKQMIYNGIGDLAPKLPDYFLKTDLKPAVDKETGIVTYPQERDPNIVMARDKNGKRLPIIMDKEIKAVLDETLTMNNINIFEKLITKTSNVFTRGTTATYPLFAMVNVLQDQVSAFVITKNGYLPVIDQFKHLLPALRKTNAKYAEYLQEYMLMAGERQTLNGWLDMKADDFFKAVAHEKKGLAKVGDYLNRGLEIMSMPSTYSEIATRATEYIKARKSGKNQMSALEDAGRVTGSFHHIGRLGGGSAGRSLIKSWPFANATMQVIKQTYGRAATDPVARKRFIVATLGITASMLGSTALLSGHMTSDQKRQLKDLHPSELTNYLFLPNPNGKGLIKIKISKELSGVGAVLNMALMNNMMGTKYGIGDYANALTSFMPDQINFLNIKRMAVSWIPQIMQTTLTPLINMKFWPSPQPLESPAMQKREPSQRFNESTSKFAKFLGGKLNVSPLKIDAVIEGLAGRTTRFVTGKEIANPFTQKYYFESGRRLQKFYQEYEKLEGQYNSFTNRRRPFSQDEVETMVEKYAMAKMAKSVLEQYSNVKKFDSQEALDLRDDALRLIKEIIGEK